MHVQIISALVLSGHSTPQAFLSAYVSDIESRLGQYSPASLHLLLRSLSSLGFLPPRPWLLTWLKHAQPKLRYFGALGILNVVRSFSEWRLRPSKDFMQVK